MKAITLSVLAVLSFANSAQANPQCLSRVSDRALLNEVARRMGENSTPIYEPGVSATFICTGNAEIQVSTTNLETGATLGLRIPTGNWDRCRDIANRLTEKLANTDTASGKIFAVCAGNGEIKKFLILRSGEIKQTESIPTGSWDRCTRTERSINDAL